MTQRNNIWWFDRKNFKKIKLLYRSYSISSQSKKTHLCATISYTYRANRSPMLLPLDESSRVSACVTFVSLYLPASCERQIVSPSIEWCAIPARWSALIVFLSDVYIQNPRNPIMKITTVKPVSVLSQHHCYCLFTFQQSSKNK